MRDQPNSSAAQRPPLTQSNSPVKWSASRSRNASGEAMPSRANAKIVFFWVSVATTWALSPSVCAASKSPRSCEVTLRSMRSCRSVSRVTRTTRFSALPYWFEVRVTSTMLDFLVSLGGWKGGSAAAVCGVGVRAEQQRHVVVTLAGNHGEFHGHAREEGVSLRSCKVDTGGEADPVVAGIQHVRPKITDAAVVISHCRAQRLAGGVGQDDLHSGGRHA